ncbi:MAG: hypothetical protein IJA72_00610 [Clostridia bacterium]|nr:hypothetical protein [Clostridia bacterium]
MSFSEDIKVLRKRYFNAVKQYYSDNRIVFKMLLQRKKYDDLYEADLAFRTCMVSEFSDKNINKLLDVNVGKAVDKLRARARGCVYTASVIQTLLEKQISPNQNPACDEINQIKQGLLNHANQSVELSDKWAKDIGVGKFDTSEFVSVYESPHSKFLDENWFCK